MAGSIYPGQGSLLDQTDSWNHRPQEISMWQPSVEVIFTHIVSKIAVSWSSPLAFQSVRLSLSNPSATRFHYSYKASWLPVLFPAHFKAAVIPFKALNNLGLGTPIFHMYQVGRRNLWEHSLSAPTFRGVVGRASSQWLHSFSNASLDRPLY